MSRIPPDSSLAELATQHHVDHRGGRAGTLEQRAGTAFEERSPCHGS
jgi:hypothetical protein